MTKTLITKTKNIYMNQNQIDIRVGREGKCQKLKNTSPDPGKFGKMITLSALDLFVFRSLLPNGPNVLSDYSLVVWMTHSIMGIFCPITYFFKLHSQTDHFENYIKI